MGSRRAIRRVLVANRGESAIRIIRAVTAPSRPMPPNSPVGQEIGYRNELAAIEDPDQRKATYEEMVARSYERGKA